MPSRPRNPSRYAIVLVMCPSEAAQKIATAVLGARVAACVNILAGAKSIYRWKGDLEEASESLLLIKTRSSLFDDLERVVKQAHPYEVPEIVEIAMTRGHAPYLDWISRSTGTGRANRSPSRPIVEDANHRSH
jgi:periplasmic divalent cation tolerance protein